MWKQEFWLKRPVASILLTLIMLVLVSVIDHITELQLSFAYFIPISFAAWTLGHGVAITAAIVSNIETINDEIELVRTTGVPWYQGSVDAILRLLVFLFVAEVTYRLIQSAADARRTAERLRVTNDELTVAYDRLNEDLTTAGLLQSSVLEFDSPSTQGCQVGACLRMVGSIGGDFVDAGFVDDRIYVCVADIAGKGIPAALFSTLLKHLLIDSHRTGLRSGDVVAALNTGLAQTLPTERFVTLFYAEIDPVTGLMEYVNAGHPDGLLLHDGTGEIEDLAPTGPILTLYPSDRDFPARAIQLDAKDSIVLYTDGAIESKTPSGARLGDEPIRRFAVDYAVYSAQEMADKICNSIEAEVAGAPGDDLTVLCVKMTAAQEVLPGLETSS